MIAAGVMLALAAIPGLPKFSFFLLAAGTAFLAWRAPKFAEEPAAAAADAAAGGEETARKDSVEDLLKLDELSLEVGYGAGAAGRQQSGRTAAGPREGAAPEPGAATRLHRSAGAYHRQRPPEAAGICHRVARRRDGALGDAPGQPAGHQLGGCPAPAARNADEGAGLRRGRPLDSSRAAESGAGLRLCRRRPDFRAGHAPCRSGAGSTRTNCSPGRRPSGCSTAWPKAIPSWSKSWCPKVLSLGEVQKVLQQLLREQVSIRDLSGDSRDLARHSPPPARTRCCWSRPRARRWAGPWCGRCFPKAEDCAWLRSTARWKRSWAAPSARRPCRPDRPRLQPPFARRILDGLRRLAGDQVAVASPVLLCATPARYHLKRLLEPFLPKVVVLSPLEVPPVIEVQSLGVLH